MTTRIALWCASVRCARWVLPFALLALACGSDTAHDNASAEARDGGSGGSSDGAVGIVWPLTLRVDELFGIEHPDQIIDFDIAEQLDTARTYRTVGDDANRTEVRGQPLANKRFCLRLTGGLGKAATRTWTVFPDAESTPRIEPNEVRVEETATAFEIKNGLTGVRVPKPKTGLAVAPIGPGDQIRGDLPTIPAPVQGLLLHDGTWTAEGSTIEAYQDSHGNGSNWRALPATKMAVRFLERGPLVTTIEVSYTLVRPDSAYGYLSIVSADPATDAIRVKARHYLERAEESARFGRFNDNGAGTLPAPLNTTSTYFFEPVDETSFRVRTAPGGPVVHLTNAGAAAETAQAIWFAPGGPGSFSTTLTLHAGQPSVLVEHDSDYDLRYALDIARGIEPDQARYQGHDASSAANGHGEDGAIYAMAHERANSDAIVDLPFAQSLPYGRSLTRWDPWASNTGWYWTFYGKDRPASANMLGIFQGRASRVLGGHASGVRVDSDAPKHATLTVQSFRASPDALVILRNRFNWGFWSGTKADAKPLGETQPIGRQMNLFGGFSLEKFHRYGLTYADPAGGTQTIWMDRSKVRDIIRKLRADTSGPLGAGYYGYVYREEPAGRPLWDAFADATGAKAKELLATLEANAKTLLDAYVNGQGIYMFPYQYWQGGLVMIHDATFLNGLLVLDEFFPGTLSPSERMRVKAILSAHANMLWDNDFVPLDNSAGFNLGTANMPVQQASYRRQYALMLTTHPTMAGHVANVRADTLATLDAIVNASGAGGIL